MKGMLAAFAAVSAVFCAGAVEITGASSGWAIVVDPGASNGIRDGIRKLGDALSDALDEQLGAKVPVCTDGRQPAGLRHAFYIGGKFARAAGLLDDSYRGLDYGIAVKDGNVYLYGNDRKGAIPYMTMGCTVPSALATARFMRKYMGVLFLMPGKVGREVPARKSLVLPDGLRDRGGALAEYQAGRSLDYPYDFANNMYGRCGFYTYGGHTYPAAAPRDEYFKAHPEYFALLKGKRAWGASKQCQAYCISNKEFQELVYRELIRRYDEGADSCELGQNDGDVKCECENCRALYGTGDDWSEKVWLFHRDLALRVLKDRPGKLVQILSYGVTAKPPKSFREFPENVLIEICSYSEESMKAWEGYTVPHGFTYYLYNWGWYPIPGFTAKRSLSGLVKQVRTFWRYGMKGTFRCGFGELFGMEGPAYYLFHRLLEDPKADARATLREYCGGAFGPAAGQMERFYDQLEEPLGKIEELNSVNAEDLVEATITRSASRDPVAALAYIYTPERVAKMEGSLSAAERTDGLSPKAIKRLRLVRAEFDYAKNLGAIATIYNDRPLTRKKFDELAGLLKWRNGFIEKLYDDAGHVRRMKDWPEIVPFGAPSKAHFRENGRLGAVIKEPLCWDVGKMLKYDLLPGVRMTPEERKREVAAKKLKPITGWREDKDKHRDGNVIETDDSCGGVKIRSPKGNDVRVIAYAGKKDGVKPGRTYRISWIVRWKDIDPGNDFSSAWSGLYACMTWGRDWVDNVKLPAGKPHYGTCDWVKESMLVRVADDRDNIELSFRIYHGKSGEAEIRYLTVEEVDAERTAYDELMPVPQRVERRSTQVPLSALDKVTVKTGKVSGAPENVAEESYALDIAPDGVVITAPAEEGVRYAKTTLGQLKKLAAGSSDIPAARIVDWPKFRWRGFMPDTARNYLPVKSLKALIDVMAAYKLNLLHWHLTEHYGWRLESRKYPELHAPKAFLNRHPGKYYTQEEFREVVDYAWERGIAVMPELDVPGHATAFRHAFDMKNMDNPRATEIIEDLFRELCTLTSVEKMPFVHMGTDEVWNKELEGARPESISRWAKAVTDSGRQVVSWDPGQAYEATNRVAMLWGGREHAGGGRPAFDANGMYIETFDPFELLPHGTYHAQFWEATAPENRLGAIFCGWHDGFVGENCDNVFRNEQIFPCCVLYGNSFWNGPAEDNPKYRTRLPLAGDPLLARAVEIERRVVAQRDKVLKDLPYPFQFVAQTHMRWRLTNERGELVAKDIAQATISPRKDPKSPGNFTEATNGTMIAETWIHSPKTQSVGAWIGFLGMDRDHGLEHLAADATTPRLGEWNIFGATAELNGEKIAPPEWKRPGLRKGKVLDWCPAPWWYELGEEPYTDQEYFMREPTPITLRKGWNHVRLTAPCPGKDISWSGRSWIMTFCPVLGTTDHPREVPDLVYSSTNPEVEGRAEDFLRGWTFSRDGGATETVDLPHDGAIRSDFDLVRYDSVCGGLPYWGHGEYVRRFAVSADELAAGTDGWRLEFDGVMSFPTVFVNGQKAFVGKNGYAPFVVPLGGLLNAGENEVRVTVDPPRHSARWYPGFGIYRDVRLVKAPSDHVVPWSVKVSFPEVTPERARIEVAYEMSLSGRQKMSFAVVKPRLWSPEAPYLYELAVGDVKLRYGIRTLRYSPAEGFFLNGVHRQMRGVCLHHDLGVFGTEFDRDAARRQLTLLKEMGCDAIRTSHNFPAPALLDLCDELGVMVLAEAFDEWKRPKTRAGVASYWDEWHERLVREFVRRERNHPCIVMWSAGNELGEDEDPDPTPGVEIARELTALFHAEDPQDRPVTAGHWKPRTIDSGIGFATDVFGANYLPHRYLEMKGAVGVIGTETCSAVATRGFYLPGNRWNKYAVTNRVDSHGYCVMHQNDYVPDVEFAAQDLNPHVYGEFVWTGFDYLGEPDPWGKTSRSSYFGIFDLCGFPKDSYWLYRSHWRPDIPTAHILPHWNWRDGDRLPVIVYTSGDEAELFVNGVSQGRKRRRPMQYRLRWDDVAWVRGAVSVRTWRKGKAWAEDRVETSGPFAQFSFSDERVGRLLFRTATAVDAEGRPVPDAAEPVLYETPDGYEVVGTCNGDAADLHSLRAKDIRSFYGKALIVFKRTNESAR